MRIRMIICFSILLSVLMWSGCTTHDALPEQTGTETTETKPSEVMQEWVFMDDIPMPEEPGSSLIDYDPSREVYITFQNVDATKYALSTNGLGPTFLIFTREHIDPAEISVDIHSQNPHEITVSEIEDLRHTEFAQNTEHVSGDARYLPFYVYQNYRGVPFARNQYRRFEDDARNNFMKLQSEAVREFYVYSVDIAYPETPTIEETLTGIDVIIGDTAYHQEIGQYRIIPGRIPLEFPPSEFPYVGVIVWGHVEPLYNDGIGKQLSFMFTAPCDLTLENFWITNENVEILDIEVQIKPPEEKVNTLLWDGKSQLTVSEGEKVTLSFIYYHPYLAELSYQILLDAVLEFEAEGTMQSMISTSAISSNFLNYHEIYAIAFDGLDMEGYYRDYCLADSWRTEYQS